jgi:hypothetical protein
MALECRYNQAFFALALASSTGLLWAVLLPGLLGSLPAAIPPSSGTTVKIALTPQRRTFKAVGGHFVAWQIRSSDTSRDQVELFNGRGEKLFSLNPLKAVEGATEMSIWDVGVGTTGLVAVAAVFADDEGRRSASLLNYSNTRGLIRAFSLDPARMIRCLAVDESDNVWALGEESGDEDPALVPMVFKYNPSGELVGRYIPRVELPPAVSKEGGDGRVAGPDALGLTKDGVWFWLPERRALVTFQRDGSHIEILNVGTPAWTSPEGTGSDVDVTFGKPVLLSSGAFVVRVSFLGKSSSRGEFYVWDKIRNWKVVSSALPAGNIVGTDGDQLVFGSAKPDWQEITLETVGLPM